MRVLYIYECCCVYTNVDFDKIQKQLQGSDLDLAISKVFAALWGFWLYTRVLHLCQFCICASVDLVCTSVDLVLTWFFIYECWSRQTPNAAAGERPGPGDIEGVLSPRMHTSVDYIYESCISMWVLQISECCCVHTSVGYIYEWFIYTSIILCIRVLT